MPSKSGMSGLGGLAGAFSGSRPATRPMPSRRDSASSDVSTASTATAVTDASVASAATVTAAPPSGQLDARAVIAACTPGTKSDVVRKGVGALALWSARVASGIDPSSGQDALRSELAGMTPEPHQRRAIIGRLGTLLASFNSVVAYNVLDREDLLEAQVVDLLVSEQADTLALVAALLAAPATSHAPASAAPESCDGANAPAVQLPPLVQLALRAPGLQTAVHQALEQTGPLWMLIRASLEAGLASPPSSSPSSSLSKESIRTATDQARRLLLALVVRARTLRLLVSLTQASEGPRVPSTTTQSQPKRNSDLLLALLRSHSTEAWGWAEKLMRAILEARSEVLSDSGGDGGTEDQWVNPLPLLLELLATELADAPLRTKDRLVQDSHAPLPSFLELVSQLVAPPKRQMSSSSSPASGTYGTPAPLVYLVGFGHASQETRRALQTDRAIHFLLVSILVTLPSFPAPLGSEEEKQVERLRKLTVSSNVPSETAEEHETNLDRSARVNKATERVITLSRFGATKLVVALTFPGAGGNSGIAVQASVGVRVGLANMVDALTRSNIKLLRTQLVSQGVPRAALTLAASLLPNPKSTGTPNPNNNNNEQQQPRSSLQPPTQTKPTNQPPKGSWIAAARAVARFSITGDPGVLWPNDRRADACAICVALWRGGNLDEQTDHPTSPLTLAQTTTTGTEQLDRFESTLALTNFASLGPEWATRVASAHATPAATTPGESSTKQPREAVREILLQRLISEDAPLVRRAYAELMVNLAEDQGTMIVLGGGTAAIKAALEAADRHSDPPMVPQTTQQWVHMVVALCAAQGYLDGTTGETGLPTRLAASAVLACTLQLPTVAQATLSLDAGTIALLVHCLSRPALGTAGTMPSASQQSSQATIVEIPSDVDPTTFVTSGTASGTEVEDVALDEIDLQSDRLGADHARASLALRASVALGRLTSYVNTLPPTCQAKNEARIKLVQAGVVQAVERAVRYATQVIDGCVGDLQQTTAQTDRTMVQQMFGQVAQTAGAVQVELAQIVGTGEGGGGGLLTKE